MLFISHLMYFSTHLFAFKCTEMTFTFAYASIINDLIKMFLVNEYLEVDFLLNIK